MDLSSFVIMQINVCTRSVQILCVCVCACGVLCVCMFVLRYKGKS